jgi:hypothetical protein
MRPCFGIAQKLFQRSDAGGWTAGGLGGDCPRGGGLARVSNRLRLFLTSLCLLPLFLSSTSRLRSTCLR